MIIITRISACVIAALVFIAATPLAADIRGTDINGKPVILRSNGTWSYILPPSNKPAACRRYTNNAIVQQRANLKRRCGFTGARWHLDYNRHYNWCMGVNAASRGANTIARRDALARCRPPPPPGQRSFINPKWNGYIVDNCVTWATTCGGGGADNFCRLKGYRKSSTWKHNRPGTTYVIGSKRVCEGSFCVGYSSITCIR